jgi:hypothetical protein
MNFLRKLIDAVQVWLYLQSRDRLALAVGRLGTVAEPVLGQSEAPTPKPKCEDRWTTEDYHDSEPLQVIDFDPFWNNNDDIDVERDIAIPTSKLDIN